MAPKLNIEIDWFSYFNHQIQHQEIKLIYSYMHIYMTHFAKVYQNLLSQDHLRLSNLVPVVLLD